ncbi:1-acyl-sn-glycerol-3-phosphate acyltransferase [Methylophaga sp. 41_12_T18]|nr:1-acyl-sn-glycerol-3-phosphate acyltransferase [Methylophaga sp. 41_12_T18]
MLFIRSLIFAGFQIVTAVLFSILAVILWPLPFNSRYKVVSQWAVLNLWLLKIICNIRYEVTGQANIPDYPCVILCKHQSAWETLALQAIFPAQAWVLKRELLWIPFFGWGLASLNPIAIDRGAGRKALQQIIDQGKQRLSSGTWVAVFPEGTRITSGFMGKFGIGGSRLAVDAAVPVIPVAHNAGKAWPRHGFIKQPGVIKLTIGDMISTEGKTASELNQVVFDWMEAEMTVLEGAKPSMQSRKKGDH